MGTDDLTEYIRKYKLTLPNQVARILKHQDKVDFHELVTSRNKHRVSNDGIELLEKMLVYDKNKRITPGDAMKHSFFDPIRHFISLGNSAK